MVLFSYMDIQGIPIHSRVFLGPMAGVTNLAYRRFMKPFGVGLSFSEMISDCGLDYGNKMTFQYLKTDDVDRPVALQLFGSDIEKGVEAVKILEANADYDILDLNFGCPVPKVTRSGAGSAMLKDPDRLYAYAKAIVEASHKPVSAKIRLGWDENSINVEETALKLQEAGICLLTIHARTAKQLYSGKPDYERIRGLGKRLSIPLCVSGDIFTPEDALKAMEIASADYVMVARGGLGNPRLITDINLALEGKPTNPKPTIQEQAAWAKEFAALLVEQDGEKVASMKLRGLLPHFFYGFPGYKKIRARISSPEFQYADLQALLAGLGA